MTRDKIYYMNVTQEEINNIDLYLKNLGAEYFIDSPVDGIGNCKDVRIELIHNFTSHFEVNNYPAITLEVIEVIKVGLNTEKNELLEYMAYLEAPFDPDYQAYVNEAMPDIDFLEQRIQNEAVISLKTFGIWDKMYRFALIDPTAKITTDFITHEVYGNETVTYVDDLGGIVKDLSVNFLPSIELQPESASINIFSEATLKEIVVGDINENFYADFTDGACVTNLNGTELRTFPLTTTSGILSASRIDFTTSYITSVEVDDITDNGETLSLSHPDALITSTSAVKAIIMADGLTASEVDNLESVLFTL